MFAEYTQSESNYENARVATRVIDKYLKEFREQFDKMENNDTTKINFMRDNSQHFVMSIDEIKFVSDEKGHCITGTVKSGTLENESEIVVSNGRHGFVVEIQKDGNFVNTANQGEKVSLFALNFNENEFKNVSPDLYLEAADNFYEKRLTKELIEHNRKVEIYDVPPTTDELDDPFKMEIDQAYWVEAKNGYLLTGKIIGGFIDIDDKIILSNGLKATVKEFDNESDYACAFDTNVGILVSGIKKGALDGVEGLTAEIKW